MTTDEVLRLYSSVKGHRTRVEREIASLLELLHAQYSSTLELRLNERLEKLEKHTHKLFDISEYLISIKYPKAREEVKVYGNLAKVLHGRVYGVTRETCCGRTCCCGTGHITKLRVSIICHACNNRLIYQTAWMILSRLASIGKPQPQPRFIYP